MQVKVGNTVYDGLNEPVMVILTDRDKTAILDLDIEDERYCHYPAGMKLKDINEWMNQDGEGVSNPWKSMCDQHTKTIERLCLEIERLKPVLLDQYVTALLAGDFTWSEDNHLFDSAEGLIAERNKRLEVKDGSK